MDEFLRGSEWHRWDLHLHTPFTRKNDNFNIPADPNISEEEQRNAKWNKFFETIENYVGDMDNPLKSIYAIGITDYFSIENYKKVIANEVISKKIPLILPNIELRILPAASEAPINIHVIFDPALSTNEIEQRFLSKLEYKYDDIPYSATRSRLIDLGKKLEPSIVDDFCAEKKAVDQFVINFSDLRKLFDNDRKLREQAIIAVSNKSTDGASGIGNPTVNSDSSDLTKLREEIYRFSDAIFSADPNSIKYFLGEKERISAASVKQKCGKLMPCIHGSDAHQYDKIFEPDNQRYCWIKANPTFNGLKQILFEPKERVRISEVQPERKPDYHCIDYLKFNDPDFQDKPIYFSNNLNCIIGGRSTGKTILLHNMARTIDECQAYAKEAKAETKTKDVNKVDVVWVDKKSDIERKIVYIPQAYLNHLSDEQENSTEIDKTIEEIVLLKQDVKAAYAKTQDDIKMHKIVLNKTILDLLDVEKRLADLQEAIKEVGNKEAIEEEIKKIQEQILIISSKSLISEEEINKYDAATARIKILGDEIKSTGDEIQYLEHCDSIVSIDQMDFVFSVKTKEILEPIVREVVEEANRIWNEKKVLVINKLKEKWDINNIELKDNLKIETELRPKIQENNAIAELSKKLQEEKSKLLQIADVNLKIAENSKIANEYYEKLISSVEMFKEVHNNFAQTVNSDASLSEKGLEFTVMVPFKRENFVRKLLEVINNRSSTFKEIIDPDNFTDSNYTKEKMKEILIGIMDEKLILKVGNTKESALRDIFDDWYNTKYNVRMDNDDINRMSPGKRALVLLKLLVELADSKWPILIDQPEDDLDNRSIFNELIPFIIEKKKERQIIVVTHNANVVLGADAEEVIVANQNGNNTNNKEKKFEYRSGAIEDNQAVLKADGSEVEDGILNKQGIQQHICDILEGGAQAFEMRKHKYHI